VEHDPFGVRPATGAPPGARHLAGDPFAASALPLYQTATFAQSQPDRFDAYDYSRTDNPTRAHVEARVAALEGVAVDRDGSGGSTGGSNDGAHGDTHGGALLYASGMAAIDGALALAPSGARVVVGRDLYGGTLRLLGELADERGLRVVDADAAELPDAIARERPALVWLESPTNPLQEVFDLRAAARACAAVGARLAVDSTMLTGVLQRPLELGADLVVLSATKHLGGHADLTAGATVTRDAALLERLARRRNARGTALAPFEAWLLDRGLETLALRVERQTASATRLAAHLSDLAADAAHGLVRVRYAGLPDADGHDLLRAQARGAGSVLALEFDGAARAAAFAGALERFTIAVSFGSTRSTVSVPHAMSHASVPAGLSPTVARPGANLVRLSIGLEDPDALALDLGSALRAADRAVRGRRALVP